MTNFYDYFNKDFGTEYTKYCDIIYNNLITAYYDICFLKEIRPYATRARYFEHFSSRLLEHIVLITWQDLVLNISKLVFDKGQDVITLNNFNKTLYQQNSTLKFKIGHPKTEKLQKFRDFRHFIMAHSIISNGIPSLDIKEAEELIEQSIDFFNDRQFTIDGKDFYISNEKLSKINNSCKEGIKGLIKPSSFK